MAAALQPEDARVAYCLCASVLVSQGAVPTASIAHISHQLPPFAVAVCRYTRLTLVLSKQTIEFENDPKSSLRQLSAQSCIQEAFDREKALKERFCLRKLRLYQRRQLCWRLLRLHFCSCVVDANRLERRQTELQQQSQAILGAFTRSEQRSIVGRGFDCVATQLQDCILRRVDLQAAFSVLLRMGVERCRFFLFARAPSLSLSVRKFISRCLPA